MKLIRRIATIILMISIVLPVCACKGDDSEIRLPADYGTYGADFARELARRYPCRAPYTDGERAAGQFIKNEFENLGFEVVTQPFSNTNGQQSNNYYIKYQGIGFISEDSDSGEYDTRRIAIIGAHYDDSMNNVQAGLSGYDGISDNASGIGCLMTCAREISSYTSLGFDVYIVAFGASNDNFTGARAFYNSLSQEEKDSIEVMYEFDSLYAGDKMYASSGYNSLVSNQKYRMRRKLYQVYDVAYDQELSSRNGYSLLYNESGIIADLNGDGVDDIYSEVSNHRSDYVVFNDVNIPIVYFDSCDYFFNSIDDMKETKNLNLQNFGGMVRGTNIDSMNKLDPILVTDDSDRLEIRINNTAFVVLESLTKGSDYALTKEQYNDRLLEEQYETEETEV